MFCSHYSCAAFLPCVCAPVEARVTIMYGNAASLFLRDRLRVFECSQPPVRIGIGALRWLLDSFVGIWAEMSDVSRYNYAPLFVYFAPSFQPAVSP